MEQVSRFKRTKDQQRELIQQFKLKHSKYAVDMRKPCSIKKNNNKSLGSFITDHVNMSKF